MAPPRILLAVLAVLMFVLPLAFASHATAALGVLLFGAATFALVPPLQIRVMQAASEAPGLASSINVGAFNLGNAVGAALGGAVISSGLGYAAIPVAGGLLAASGLLLAWLGRPRTAVAEAC
jgi:DHA1 family inner membrane transport protein